MYEQGKKVFKATGFRSLHCSQGSVEQTGYPNKKKKKSYSALCPAGIPAEASKNAKRVR